MGIEREKVHLDTKAEMLVYAREKSSNESIQKNLELERNQANWRVSQLVQEKAYLSYILSSWQHFQPNPFSPIHPIESQLTRLLAELRVFIFDLLKNQI